jgi:hypothetical protein
MSTRWKPAAGGPFRDDVLGLPVCETKTCLIAFCIGVYRRLVKENVRSSSVRDVSRELVPSHGIRERLSDDRMDVAHGRRRESALTVPTP